MTEWLGENMDFIFVLYGAAFIAMGVMAGAVRNLRQPGLAWPWLQYFGIVHGLYEWSEALTFNLGETAALHTTRHVLLAVSFLLLLEFGRRREGLSAWRQAGFLLLGLMVAGASVVTGEPRLIRYGIAGPAALLSAYALWTAGAQKDQEARLRRTAALLILFYGFLAGVVVPPAYAGLAAHLNEETFRQMTGLPVQLFRMLVMAGVAACLWWTTIRQLGPLDRRTFVGVIPLHIRNSLLLLLLVLGLGGLATHQLGRRADQEQRQHLLHRVQAVAVSLNADQLTALNGQPAQEMTRVHQQAVRALTAVQRISADVAQVYLYARHGTSLVFYACSMGRQPETYLPAGQVYEGDLAPEDLAFFDHGRAYVTGPYRDRWGEWVSASAPVLWSDQGTQVTLALGMDLPAREFLRNIQLNRGLGLVLTMALTLLVLDFFARQRRFWLAAQKLAVSESGLRNLSAELEAHVHQRTAELEATNQALQREVSAHREAELKFRTLTDQLPAITYTVALRPHPHTTFISPQVQDLLGYTPAEWLAAPELWMEIIHPEDRERMMQEVERKNASGEAFDLECRQVARDGTVRWFRNTARFQFDAEGRPLQVHGVMLDITDRIQIAQDLRETADRYRLLFEYSPVGIFHYDRHLVLTRCNQRFADILKSSQQKLVGLHLRHLKDPSVLPALERVLTGNMGHFEGLYRATTSSAEVWLSIHTAPILDSTGEPSGGVGIVEDISERRRIEEERTRSQKLESLGLLAGGIAHDFNNILTSILGNISMLRLSGASADQESQEILAEAERATKRAKDLTHQLLTFAKGGAPVKSLVRVDDLIRETVSFALRGSASRCELQLAPNLWAAEVDAGQISQVIQNLIINADQAMPEGGTITVQADNLRLGENEQPVLAAGAYLRLQIRDTGVGIPAKHLERIFDPYFTTKSKGSGLGLTTSFSIVRKHGGHLTVSSEVGRGSLFTAYLPAREHGQPACPLHPPTSNSPAATQGRLLVMDDEPSIRDLMNRMLARAGFEVDTAPHGEAALELFTAAQTRGTPYRAVILDLTIPGGLGGRETFLRLKTLEPNVCALVASGYSDQTLAESLALGFAGVVPKPFTAAELVRAVRDVLARTEA